MKTRERKKPRMGAYKTRAERRWTHRRRPQGETASQIHGNRLALERTWWRILVREAGNVYWGWKVEDR